MKSSTVARLNLLIAAFALAVGGCSDLAADAGGDPGAADGDGSQGTADGESGPSTTDPGGGTAGDANDAGLDDTGTGGTPPGEDETGGSGIDESCDIDCGAGGYCELDEYGAPECICDEGLIAVGLQCLTCSPTSGAIAVDIPMVGVTAEFTLAGQPFPASAAENASIWLRDRGSGDAIELGQTRDGAVVEAVSVIPGNYDVYYEGITGGSFVPSNTSARIETLRIPQGNDYHLTIDVPRVELNGEFLFNGEAAPASAAENGTMFLVNPSTGDEIELGDTQEGSFSTMVLPGVYDVYYRQRLTGDIAPANKNARVDQITVYGDSDIVDYALDVGVTTLSGNFMIDGDAPPTSAAENGLIIARDLETGDETILGETRNGEYAVTLATGSYEIVYRRLLGGDFVPVNRSAVLGQVDLASANESYDVEISTAVISGAIQINGALPPTSGTNDGLLVLRSLDGNDEAELGHTTQGVYTRRVIIGTYDVYYRVEASTGLVPVNANARLETIEVTGGSSFDIDIPIVAATASVTMNGALPPDSAYDDGLLYLRNREEGDSVLLGATRMASLARPVIPGDYDVVYAVEAAGPTVPVNAEATVDSVDLGATPAFGIDIPVAPLGGPITVNGGEPPGGVYNRGELWLRDVDTDDTMYLGIIEPGQVLHPLTAGTYLMSYHSRLSTGLVPTNESAVLGCYELTP